MLRCELYVIYKLENFVKQIFIRISERVHSNRISYDEYRIVELSMQKKKKKRR